MHPTSFLDGAKQSIARGWKVFPCWPRSKSPATPNGFKNATDNLSQIDAWANSNPNFNLTIRCGKDSDLAVMEFDVKNGGDDSLKKFIAIYGDDFLNTYTVRSGGGGIHLYYRMPGWSFTNKTKLGGFPGVDTRGDGGYIIAPPSIHPNGNTYIVEKDVEIAKCPDWIESLMHPKADVADVLEDAADAQIAASATKAAPGRLSWASLYFMIFGAVEGTWNDTLFVTARDAHDQGYSKAWFSGQIEKMAPLGYLTAEDIKTIGSGFSPTSDEKRQAKRKFKLPDGTSPLILASRFMRELRLDKDLLRWNKSYYRHDGQKYIKKSDSDIDSLLIWFLNRLGGINITKGLISDVLLNINGHIHVESDLAPPCWVRSGTADLPEFIPMDNGLVSLDDILSGLVAKPVAHTSDYFNTVCLPFAYAPAVRSEKWERFLCEVLPDLEVQALLQEWFGYNLIHDTTYDKFMLFQGEGGDGKSVVSLVLTELLGPDNCSAVSLEGFNVERSYHLASTAGKLANIIGDQNHIEKAQEGVLKTFVSGEGIGVEEKYKDPYVMYPTARITASCNTLPRFSDKSKGLWRRMLLINFPNSREEKDQKREVRTAAYWRAELPGIFNWAAEGLKRLRSNGGFTIPVTVQQAKVEYQKDMNPAMQFLIDGYEYTGDTDHRIAGGMLLDAYTTWCSINNYKAMGDGNFRKEVLRTFPLAQYKTAKLLDNSAAGAVRAFLGLRERSAEESDAIASIGSKATSRVVQMESQFRKKKGVA